MALSPILSALGYGDQLADQVAGETEEERKKRLLRLQQQGSSGSSLSLVFNAISGSALGAYGR
jgi:hypothetical protein